MTDDTAHDHNYTPHNRWGSPVSEIGNGSVTAKYGADLSESVIVTETDTRTTDDAVEISLSDLGCDVPASATVDVTIRSVGADHLVLEVARRDDVYIVEGATVGVLTGVVGRDRRPERVPDWLLEVCGLFGVDEVTL